MSGHVPAFLGYMAAARTPEEIERAAVPMRAFELYRSVEREGRCGASEAAECGALLASVRGGARRTDHDSASAVRGEEALGAMLAALPAWGLPGVGAVAREAVFAAWVEFGLAMADEGHYELASLVLRTAGADAEIAGSPGTAALLRHLAGFVALLRSEWDDALMLYRRGWELGRDSWHWATAYRAMLGEANVHLRRGNLPAADAVIGRALRGALRRAPSVVPRALLMRAGVAHARGEFEHGVIWAVRALEAGPDPTMRTRILIDLGSLLSEFPESWVAEVAELTLEWVVAHAPELSVRHHAALDLMSLAIEQRRPERFLHHRALLAPAPLRPRHAVLYRLFAARGERVFELGDAADSHLDEADRLARLHGLGQLAFMVEDERKAWAASARTTTAAAEPPSPPVIRTGRGRRAVARARDLVSAL